MSMGLIARALNAALARVGLRVDRIERPGIPGGQVPFYRPPESCQITELAALYHLFLGDRDDGFFVEVGAYDGISFSNSSCLADAGWSGLLIEPIPAYAQACRVRYADNPRVRVIESAVGAESSTIDIMVAGALTTTRQHVLDSYREIAWAKPSVAEATRLSVTQRTLDDILAEAAPATPIDVLIVDVEGAEAAVFAGFSLERWRPGMLIVELVHTHPDLYKVSVSDAQIQKEIERHGYSVAYKDCINTVFVRDR
jgi:FkbM family methyltransferase